MADINYTGDVYTQYMGEEVAEPVVRVPEPEPSALHGMANFVGAVASLALLVGIGVWGYKLVMRDVSGVPVVRALEGPMRVQPDDPGGIEADHQGLAVNAVAADGAAAPTADRVVLAPRPVQLLEEDAPAGKIDVQPVSLTTTDLAPEAGEVDAAVIDALVEQLTAGVEPLSDDTVLTPIDVKTSIGNDNPDTPAEEAAEVSDTAPSEAQPVIVTGPGLKRSLRPQSRPDRALSSGGADAVLSSAINAAVDTVASQEVDPNSLADGTRLAQLGAYESAEVARSEWDKLSLRFEDYMDGKQRVIQKASSGGRTFYRLRALGFADLSDARRFCSALVSENADCIPVISR